ncbi:PIN domain-containing protein [Candidatus Poribacteria bacterium]|nr:PIN domain-containing protein [Candidatus Poribacteria bacterium]
MNELYVLDTHILIWYFIGSKRLPNRAKQIVDDCLAGEGFLLIPTIVLSESLDIAEKRRVEFDFTTMYRLIQMESAFVVIGYSQEIFEETLAISEIQEIHDRIIVATARLYSAHMLTKDQIIKTSGEVETI